MIIGKIDSPPVPTTPSTSHGQSQLTLNPDPPPRRKSTWASGCKCLFITGFLFLVLFVIVTFVVFIRTAHRSLKAPHPWLYQNATWGEVKEKGAVVRPLVDREQGFDVLATVWMRNRHGQKEEVEEVGVNETVVFSGKVFEGLKLRDKHVRRKVELTLPTRILCVSFFPSTFRFCEAYCCV
jgi:hypothetical protein